MGSDGDGIGYRKPPRHTRFRKGQSGNPRGRPKGSRNLATLLNAELQRKVTITEGGCTRRVPKAAAMAISQVNKAMKGDTRAFSTVLQVTTRRLGGVCAGDSEDTVPISTDEARDRLLDRLDRINRQHAEDRDRMIDDLQAKGVAEQHLDHLFGPRGDRLRTGLSEALKAALELGFDIRKIADFAIFAEVTDECVEAILADRPDG